MLDGNEVAKHNSRESCWVVISGKAYDTTEFLDEHPGGAAIILKYAGKDATEEYKPVHPTGTIEKYLDASKQLGEVKPDTIQYLSLTKPKTADQDDTGLVPLDYIINLDDFDKQAQRRLNEKSFAYYASAADDLASLHANRSAFQKVKFNPRALVNISQINHTTTLLGSKCQLPFYIAPAAQARLAHPDGELNLVKAAAAYQIPYCVSNQASCSPEEIAAVATPGQTLWMQLYVNRDRAKTEATMELIRNLGCYSALWVTVDTPVVGKREADERIRTETAVKAGLGQGSGVFKGGLASQASGFLDQTLSWDDLPWLTKMAGGMPIILKGIQSVHDAVRAYDVGVKGICLSNHGGRQLDHAPSGLHTLIEIHQHAPHLLNSSFEIYVDGGMRRGTDVLKCIALGAKACGFGRPFLYSLVGHGKDGATHACSIIAEEILTGMKLLGRQSLAELTPECVNTTLLDAECALDDSIMKRRMRGWTQYRIAKL